MACFLAEREAHVANPPHSNPYSAPPVSSFDSAREDDNSRRLRILGPNPTPMQKEAWKRGLYNPNRFITPGIATWVEESRTQWADGRASSYFSASEIDSWDYRIHLRIRNNQVKPYAKNRFVSYAYEHQSRVALSRVRLQGLGNEMVGKFDVEFARRASDLPYLSYLMGVDFETIRNAINDSPPTSSSSNRVSRVFMGPETVLCEHDGVPWEKYLLELPATTSDNSAITAPSFRRCAPPPVHYTSGPDGSKLVIKPSMMGDDGQFLGYAVIDTPLKEEARAYTPLSWRRQERSKRHRYGCFSAGTQCEIDIITRRAVDNGYPRVPNWWADVEVPYGFWNGLPRILYYQGSKFLAGASAAYEVLLRSEWARSVATHLIYEARGGRLWWVPMAVRQDIRILGLEDESKVGNLPPGNDVNQERMVRRGLKRLLEYIDMIAWEKIPSNGVIPEYPDLGEEFSCSGGLEPDTQIGRITPVHRSGDWVIFDPERWCLHLPDKYFVPFKDDSTKDFDPEHPRVGREYDGDDRNAPLDAEQASIRDWQQRQVDRIRARNPNASVSLPSQAGPSQVTIPVATRIERTPTRQEPSSAQRLLDALADRGITNLDDLLGRLGGNNANNSNRGNPDNNNA